MRDIPNEAGGGSGGDRARRSDGQAPLFSVIVPFLNEARWMAGCLAALRAQTIDPRLVEWICVDNGSTDDSAAIVSAEPRATLVAEPQRDPYLARNRGILAARGRYLVFLDADCLADPDWLTVFHQEIARQDAAILLGYIAYPAPRSLALQVHEDYEDTKLRSVLARGPSTRWFGHAGNMVVRADVFADIGLFRPMPVVGDTEIIQRLLERNPDAVVRYAPGARVVHAEVDSFRACLVKLGETGAHARTVSAVSGYRPLSVGDRLRIAAACARMHGYGPIRRLALLGVLALGNAAFFAGWLARRLRMSRAEWAAAFGILLYC